jgi:hypothetical protein
MKKGLSDVPMLMVALIFALIVLVGLLTYCHNAKKTGDKTITGVLCLANPQGGTLRQNVKMNYYAEEGDCPCDFDKYSVKHLTDQNRVVGAKLLDADVLKKQKAPETLLSCTDALYYCFKDAPADKSCFIINAGNIPESAIPGCGGMFVSGVYEKNTAEGAQGAPIKWMRQEVGGSGDYVEYCVYDAAACKVKQDEECKKLNEPKA